MKGGEFIRSYENYTDSLAIKFFVNNSNTGYIGTKTEDISNNKKVRLMKSTKRMVPNLIGYVADDHHNNPGVELHVVCWLESLAGHNDESITAFREDVEKKYDDYKKTYPWFNFKLWFLPQVKSGANKEDFNKVIPSR